MISTRDAPALDNREQFNIPTIIVVDDSIDEQDFPLPIVACCSSKKINDLTAAQYVSSIESADNQSTQDAGSVTDGMLNNETVSQPVVCTGSSRRERQLDSQQKTQKQKTQKQKTSKFSQLLRQHNVLGFEEGEVECHDRKFAAVNKVMHFPRRSYSQPDQLNLIGDEEQGLVNNSGLANGGLWRHSQSLVTTNDLSPTEHADLRQQAYNLRAEVNETNGDGVGFLVSEEEHDSYASNLWTRRPTEFKLRDQLYSFFQASDNKLAMKLFGSRTALLKEKRRQMAEKNWIIHPCSNFR